MGILKDLLGLGNDKKDTRPEKSERIRVEGGDTRKSVYDSEGHWKEDLRWNPESDRWDKLDMNGNVTGHIERDALGNMRHTDYYENTVQVDKIKDFRTLEHYDSKGNKTGYTTKDYSNNLTKHTYIEEEKDIFGRTKNKPESSSKGFLGSLVRDIEEHNRKVEAIHKEYEEEIEKIREKYRSEEDHDSLYDEDDDCDDLFDDDGDEYRRRRRRRDYSDEYDFDDDDDEYDEDDEYDDDDDEY